MTGSRPTLALVDELTRLLIVPSGVTGCGSLVLGDELTGATSSGSCPALDLDLLALVYMLGQLQRIQPEALDAPDFVGIGAKPARQDGRRGPRSSRSGPLLIVTSPRPRCCPVRSQARQGGKLDRPVVLTRA